MNGNANPMVALEPTKDDDGKLFRKLDTRGYKIFSVFNLILMIILSILWFLPFWHIFCKSISSGVAITSNAVTIYPMEITFKNYQEAFQNVEVLQALWVSLKRVFLGTLFTMVTTILTAFPLSYDEKEFPSRKVYRWYFIFTMLFGGGLIPTYILLRNIMHLNDTIWVLTVPGAVVTSNIIMLMNFFRNLPKEISEAAIVDGAGHMDKMWRIYMPLSIPCLATLTTFCVIGHWNAWFDAIIYNNSPTNYPLSTYLQVYGSKLSVIRSMRDAQRMMEQSTRSLSSAYTIICTVPILCIFPLLQKYIRSGLTVGAVKG